MAKNKKKTNGSSDKAPAAAETQKEEETCDVVETDAAEAAAVQPNQEEETGTKQSGLDSSVQEQLNAALTEIQQLKSSLAAKDAEISALKHGGSASTPAPSEDVQKLQERLQQLKKEQAEADSAREAAWRQLKSVVSEISRLAGPDASKASGSISTPTGTPQAV